MKIAISSDGTARTSAVDPRFGRARWLLLYDDATGRTEALDNKASLSLAQGAGIQAAKRVIDSGAEALLTGHCGPKAFDALTAGRVRVYVGVAGTVEEAIAAFERGELESASEPNAKGHAGF